MKDLVDLKSTKKEIEMREDETILSRDEYPYGLELYLNEETLEKLGINPEKVGEKIMFIAESEVSSISSNKNENHESRNVNLKIKKMAVETGEKKASEAFYGD